MELIHEKRELKTRAFDFAVFVLGATAMIIGFSFQNAIVLLTGLGIMFLPVHFMHNHHTTPSAGSFSGINPAQFNVNSGAKNTNVENKKEGASISELVTDNEMKELFAAMDGLLEKIPVDDIESFSHSMEFSTYKKIMDEVRKKSKVKNGIDRPGRE